MGSEFGRERPHPAAAPPPDSEQEVVHAETQRDPD